MSLKPRENRYILTLRKLTKEDSKKARELFKKKFDFYVTQRTILKRWEKNGYKPKNHGGNRGFTRETFQKFYDECEGDITIMLSKSRKIKEGGYTLSGLVDACSRYGLEKRNRPSPNRMIWDFSKLDHYNVPESNE